MSSHISEEKIALFAGGDLDAQQAAGVDVHLGRCSMCAELLKSYRQGRAALGTLREEESDTVAYQAMRAAVLKRIEGKPARPLWLLPSLQWAISTAAIVLVLVLGWWLTRRPSTLPVAKVATPAGHTATDPGAISPQRPEQRVLIDQSPANERLKQPPMPVRRPRPSGETAIGVTGKTQRSLPERPAIPDDVAIRMETADPNVIIFWLASPRGEER